MKDVLLYGVPTQRTIKRRKGLGDIDEEIKRAKDQIKFWEVQKYHPTNEIENGTRYIKEFNQTINSLNVDLESKLSEVAILQNALTQNYTAELYATYQRLNNDVANIKKSIAAKQEKIKYQQEKINEAQQKLNEYNAAIDRYKQTLADLQSITTGNDMFAPSSITIEFNKQDSDGAAAPAQDDGESDDTMPNVDAAPNDDYTAEEILEMIGWLNGFNGEERKQRAINYLTSKEGKETLLKIAYAGYLNPNSSYIKYIAQTVEYDPYNVWDATFKEDFKRNYERGGVEYIKTPNKQAEIWSDVETTLSIEPQEETTTQTKIPWYVYAIGAGALITAGILIFGKKKRN